MGLRELLVVGRELSTEIIGNVTGGRVVLSENVGAKGSVLIWERG